MLVPQFSLYAQPSLQVWSTATQRLAAAQLNTLGVPTSDKFLVARSAQLVHVWCTIACEGRSTTRPDVHMEIVL